MVVKVTSVKWNAGKARRAEVSLLDNVGNPLRLVDYEGANLSVNWTQNHRYRVSRCGVNNGGNRYAVELAPSKRTRVEPLGPTEERVRLLVVGDTHVGRTKHPKTKEEIDPVGAFIAAVEYGLERKVDAVLHVGDIFHESATPLQAASIDQHVFVPLQKAGIPFYYVRGNHASEAGDDVLSKHRHVSNLDTTGVTVGSDIRVFGINHYEEGALPWKTLTFPSGVTEPISVLVLHQTLRQLSGSGPKSVDLSRVQRKFGSKFDFVLSGHHHDATVRKWNGVPVMYTGASEHMSKNQNATDRVAWLLTADNSSVTRERFDIP